MTARKNKPKSAQAHDQRVRGKSIVIDVDLHSALKSKAQREGRVLQKMVEEKLGELVAPEQLQLVAEPAAV